MRQDFPAKLISRLSKVTAETEQCMRQELSSSVMLAGYNLNNDFNTQLFQSILLLSKKYFYDTGTLVGQPITLSCYGIEDENFKDTSLVEDSIYHLFLNRVETTARFNINPAQEFRLVDQNNSTAYINEIPLNTPVPFKLKPSTGSLICLLDLVTLKKQRVVLENQLKRDIGVIQYWTNPTNNPSVRVDPDLYEWAFFTGQQFSIAQYPDLYEAWGDWWANGQTPAPGNFFAPDPRNRVLYGLGSSITTPYVTEAITAHNHNISHTHVVRRLTGTLGKVWAQKDTPTGVFSGTIQAANSPHTYQGGGFEKQVNFDSGVIETVQQSNPTSGNAGTGTGVNSVRVLGLGLGRPWGIIKKKI